MYCGISIKNLETTYLYNIQVVRIGMSVCQGVLVWIAIKTTVNSKTTACFNFVYQNNNINTSENVFSTLSLTLLDKLKPAMICDSCVESVSIL